MINNYSKNLVNDYRDYMLKNNIIVSNEESQLHLDSFATVYLSFVDINEVKDNKIKK